MESGSKNLKAHIGQRATTSLIRFMGKTIDAIPSPLFRMTEEFRKTTETNVVKRLGTFSWHHMCRQLEGSIEVWDNRGPEDSGNQYLGMGRDCGLSSGKKGVYAIRLLGILGIDVVAKSRWFNPVPGMITDYSDYQEQAGSTYLPIIPDNVKEKINQFNENWEEHNKNYRGRVWLFRRRVAATIGSILLALTVANFAYEYSNDGPAEKMSVMEEYYPNGAPNP